jgi:hypothetical protein
MDESKERLNRKRKDILAKVRSKEALRRQTEMLRKTEMALSGHRNSGIELNGISNSGIESEESGDEHESELEEQIARMSVSATLPRTQPTTDDVVVGGLSPGRTTTKSSSLDITPKTSDEAKKNRRTVLQASAKIEQPAT